MVPRPKLEAVGLVGNVLVGSYNKSIVALSYYTLKADTFEKLGFHMKTCC